MAAATVLGTATALQAGHYLHLGVFSISLANALIIVAMLLMFVAAILVPFPHSGYPADPGGPEDGDRP